MRDSESTQSVITLAQVGQVLKGGWTNILTWAILGLVLGWAFFTFAPASYTSVSAVSISPGIMTGSPSPKDISTETESAIATSTAVADRAALLLKWPGAPAKLLDSVSVTSPVDSQVLKIRYSAPTPRGAAAGANAFATAYLAYRTDTVQAGLEARLERTGERIAELQKASDLKNPILADPNSSAAKIAAAKAQQSLIARQVNQLQDQQVAIATTTVSAGHLVTKGFPPSDQDFSRTTVLLGGQLIGVVVGVVLTMLRNPRETKVRNAGDIEDRFTVAVLESIPEQRPDPGEPTALAMLKDLGGKEADAYRSLAAKMTVGVTPSCRRLLLVAAGDLRPATTPVGLAVILAAQGQRVLLLGSQEAMTNACRLVIPGYAVTDVPPLTGTTELLRTGGLRVVSFGDELSLVATLRKQGNDEPGSMLAEVDILLIDGINVDLASTPLTLALLADDALVLARTGVTRVDDINRSLHVLRQVVLPVQGIVLLVPTHAPRPRAESRDGVGTQGPPLGDPAPPGSSRSNR